MNDSYPPIRLIGVTKRFGDNVVLDGFNAELCGGKALCVGGRSGVGKTTLLRILCGLDVPDAGQVAGLPPATSYQFQENRLLPWYTASRNLSLFTKEPDEWLARVGLSDAADRYPDELSGGMRRRLSLARALCAPAPMLILDEPFSELDADSKSIMIRLVREQSAGDGRGWIILVTHDRDDAVALGWDYVEMMGNGFI